jgi:hypothetical protein
MLDFQRRHRPRTVDSITHHGVPPQETLRHYGNPQANSTKPSQSVTVRAFHNTPLKQHPHLFKTNKPAASASQHVAKFRQTFRRSYQQAAYNPAAQGDLRQRLMYGAGIFGATLIGINFVFNRETREDGGMPPFERA